MNISRADVYQKDLPGTILSLTRKYNIDPAYLHLEITESAYTDNPDQLVATVETLRDLGFIVEMDDFGSGYSSLNTLSQMPLDILKLDMKFVQNELNRSADRSLLGDVVNMAHRAHMQVVAEGVESRDQMNRLKAVGCDYAQGYFFSKPLPAPEYELLLKSLDVQAVQDYLPDLHNPRTNKSCVLVAEEDDAYRKRLVENFTEDFLVLEATTAEEVRLHLESRKRVGLDAVVLSMTLPEQGANTVLGYLRHAPIFWNCPILATVPYGISTEEFPMILEVDEFLCKHHPITDIHRRVVRMIDMAFFHQKENDLQQAAVRDPMTGLLNRRGLQNAMNAIADSDISLVVCLFDVDNLKKVNDTYGHAMGDRMLRSFAEVLTRMTRAEDIKCRYGGDEFVAVLKGLDNPDIARKKGADICAAFQKCGEKLGFTPACSVGMALSSSDDRMFAKALTHADQALYQAKRLNKGGCCLWEEG